jgi:DNA modification methylase
MSTFRLICADALQGLRQLPDESVDCIVTSPPYWGLRAYGTQPQIWDAAPGCQHEWGEAVRTPWANDVPGPNGRVKNLQASRKAKWTGPFCSHCGAWRGELGSEPTYHLYIAHIVTVFTEAHRVLRKTGTTWLNIGDCFATGAGKVGQCPGGGEQGERWAGYRGTRGDSPKHAAGAIGPMTQPNRLPQPGLKPKDLCMIPHRIAIALQEAGWWVRMDVVWSKPNPLPESVEDRPTKSHEYVFLLSKSERYFYNVDAIREPYVGITVHDQTGQGYIAPGQTPQRGNRATSHKGSSFSQGKTGVNGLGRVSEAEREDNPAGRNKRSVWTINTEPYPDAHFAVMPEALVEPCILAGCPPSGKNCDCSELIQTPTGTGCIDDPTLEIGRAGLNRPRREGEGRRPINRRQQRGYAEQLSTSPFRSEMEQQAGSAFAHYIRTDKSGARPLPDGLLTEWLQIGWLVPVSSECNCPEAPAGVVLDPFCGSGTVGAVSLLHRRNFIGIDLNPDYIRMARERIYQASSPLLEDTEVA